MSNTNSFYNEDIAFIHDTGYAALPTNAADMIIKTLQTRNITKGLIIDLGSGSGIIAKILTERGYDVLGIEYSESFIKIARKKAPKAQFVRSSFFDIEIPPCSAVISIGECLGYMAGIRGIATQKKHRAALEKLFERISQALKPGGVFIFDLLEPNHQSPRNINRIVEHADWTIFTHIVENSKTDQLTRHITSFLKTGALYKKTKEVHSVQLYKRDNLSELLRAYGFDVTIFHEYEKITFHADHVGFLCTKQ